MIVTMTGMRNLEDSFKIPARSIPEITDRFATAVSRQKNIVRRPFGDRKKITAEVITNAVVLHFLTLSERQQDELLDRFVPALVSMLAGESASLPASPPEAPATQASPPRITADLTGFEAPKSRRRSR